MFSKFCVGEKTSEVNKRRRPELLDLSYDDSQEVFKMKRTKNAFQHQLLKDVLNVTLNFSIKKMRLLTVAVITLRGWNSN